MSKKRAFVRYSKQGKIVPGSLILTAGSYPNGPSTWKEVPADLCCEPAVGPMQRCVINTNVETEPDPYLQGGDPYFAMERQYITANFPYTFTLNSLNINGIDYASGQVLTLNSNAELQVGVGLDGRSYFMNVVDWLNNIIPSSTKVVFYDDMNVIDAPVGTLFSISITLSWYDGIGGLLTSQNYFYTHIGFAISEVGLVQGAYLNCTPL